MDVEKVVCVKPIHLTITGCLNAAYLLGQIIYWDKIHEGNEFYNTDEDLATQLQIGLKAFRGAKIILKNMGIVSIVLRGTPARSYYKLNQEILKSFEKSMGQSDLSSLPKRDKLDCLQKANLIAQNRQTSLPQKGQTTTKSTTKITTNTLLSVSSKRPVADAPLETLFSDQDCLEGISNPSNTDQTEASLFPPRGCVEGSSSQLQNPELLKVNSLQGFGVGCSYGVSFAKPSLGGSFSAVLKNTSKTGLFSDSEGQSLVSIGKSQKTPPDTVNGPAIDMLDEKRDSESQKVSSRKKPKKENRGTRIDETMTLDKTKLDIALNQGFHGSWVASELEEFVGYYANPNLAPSKAFHVNWDAAWRNWCKNAILYDRYEKKTKPHPTLSEPAFSSSAASLSSPVMHPRLQAFVTTHHQLGSNAFAFQSCEVVERADKIILQVPSRHCLDKVDLYHRELEDHFGKEVEMVIKAPQPQVVEEKPAITLSEADFLEPRLKAFLEKNIQIDAGVHFAFKATTITETADTIILHNDSAYGLGKIDFYASDLEKFFGKRVEIPSKTPPRSPHPQPLPTVERPKGEDDTTRKYSPNNNDQGALGVVSKESLKNFRTTPVSSPPGVNTFPYKAIGVVLQEARQGVGR